MQHHNRINHQGLPSTSGLTLPVIDPATGETFAQIARSNAQDVDVAVQGARACLQGPWAALDATDRGRLLMALSRRVSECASELAAIEQRDCGKPTQQARADVVALARYFEFYAGACDKLHGDTLPYRQGYTALSWREPHGVTGHVIPWNYPLQIFGRSVGGALAAGNVCVVKPAEDACLSLLRVSELMAEVGFPAGSIQIVTGLGHEAGQALCEHPGIDHISFTGSPRVGTLVQQLAAAHHCPVTLELGGKSPQIIFDDADLDAAIPVVVMLAALAFFHIKAHIAAIMGLVSALVVAVFGFTMPGDVALSAAAYGACYGLFPIGWIILNVIFLYQLTERKGQFKILRESIAGISGDRRLQLLLIAFSFGAFFEGAGGFGDPDADGGRHAGPRRTGASALFQLCHAAFVGRTARGHPAKPRRGLGHGRGADLVPL